MILNHIELRNFRSYDYLDLDLSSGLNLIVGENAVGKTNLAEAIYYLSLARSWRTLDDGNLIKDGKEFALINASISEGELHRQIEIRIEKNAKKIRINGNQIRRLSDLSKLVNVIVFSPNDTRLFRSPPSERRNFLDVAISKKYDEYLTLIGGYSKLLKERNALLKQDNPNLDLLNVLTEQMIKLSEPIIKYRVDYVSSINSLLPSFMERLRGDKKRCSIVYKPFVSQTDNLIESMKKAYLDALESDLSRRQTSVGIHREDFCFKMDGQDVGLYGSQGENRIASLAVKLIPYLLIESKEKKPICALDDVTSELDKNHVERLLNIVKKFSQVFITATKLEIEGASVIEVAANNAKRR